MASLPRNRQRAGALALVPAEPAATADGTAGPVSFEQAYALHAGYVAGLAGRILGRNDEVADVVQEVFLVAHRHLAAVRHPAAVRTWLGRITVREAGRRLRWRRLRHFFQPAGGEVDVIAEEAADVRLLVALLYAALDRLAARERTAWILRHLLDEPLDRVAELCGCSLATVKRRIAAAEAYLGPLLRPPTESEGNR